MSLRGCCISRQSSGRFWFRQYKYCEATTRIATTTTTTTRFCCCRPRFDHLHHSHPLSQYPFRRKILVAAAAAFRTTSSSSSSTKKHTSTTAAAASTSAKQQPQQQQQQQRSLLRRKWEDGSILLALGWAGLTLVAIDRFLQYQTKQEAADMVDFLVEETAHKHAALQEHYAAAPALFSCRIIQEYRMGGSHGLTGPVRRNDVVEVLQEGVGPGQYYNLCRIVRKKNNGSGEEDDDEVSIGWYPIGFMQKVPPHEAASASTATTTTTQAGGPKKRAWWFGSRS